MLVLSRRTNQSLVIDGRIRLTVIRIRGGQVRVAIEAPREVPIARSELIDSGAAHALDAATVPAPAPLPLAQPAPLLAASRRTIGGADS